jgi:hypothetical protein
MVVTVLATLQPVGESQRAIRRGCASRLDRPIFIIGAPRSGTTLLGKVMRQHRDVCYIEEPRMIWRYGNDSRSDMLKPEHARSNVIDHIRSRFAGQVRESGRIRLVEKSPSNALRMEFVDRVFPDARFIHIIRHGMDSVLSIRALTEAFSGGVTHQRMVRRTLLRLREMSPRQYPHYAGEFFRRLLPRKLAGARAWGPRIPGLAAIAQELDSLEVSCLQWRLCVETACHAGRAMPAHKYMELRLEDLSTETINEVLAFCELPSDSSVNEFIRREFDDAAPGGRRSSAASDELDRMRRWVEPTLAWLGYEN